MATVSRKKYRQAIRLQSKAVPGYVRRLKAAGLRSTGPEELVGRFLTGTLLASETAFEGEPEGKRLPYQPGHQAEGAAEREAVLSAAGTWGTVGYANDAKGASGQSYGIFIELKDRDHKKAHDAMLPVLQGAAPEAWKAAMAEATR